MICIGFATRFWAEENEDRLPPDLSTLSNEIITLKILICPSDATTQVAQSWASLTTNNSSYQRDGLSAVFGTNTAFLRCSMDGFVLSADGNVFDGNRRIKKGMF